MASLGQGFGGLRPNGPVFTEEGEEEPGALGFLF